MRNLNRMIVLVVGVMSLFAALAGAANASWTNTGSTTFTATTGPGTLSTSAASLTCSAATATGTAPASSAGSTYVVTGNITYSPCAISGTALSVTCTYTLTATRTVTGGVSGSAAVSCAISSATTGRTLSGCTITGSIPGTYTNPVSPTPGRLSVNGSSGLTVGSSCVLIRGAAGLLPNPQVYTVTSGLGPNITQP